MVRKEPSTHVYPEFEALRMPIGPFNLQPSDVREIREAMELVSVLACVDPEAWAQTALVYTPYSNAWYSDRTLVSLATPRFQLSFEGSISILIDGGSYTYMDYRPLLKEVFEPLRLGRRSAAYQSTLKQLLALVEDEETLQRCQELQIPIKFSGLFFDPPTCSSFQTALELYAPRSSNSLALGCPMTLEDVALELVNPRGILLQAAELAQSIAASTLPLRSLRLRVNRATSSLVHAGALLHPSVTHVDIDCHLANDPDVIRTFTTLAVTKTVESVHITPSYFRTRIRNAVLRWMAFAFFNRCAVSPVHTLELNANELTLGEVAAMKQVIKAKNPLQVLLQSNAPSCQAAALVKDLEIDVLDLDAPVLLKKGTTIWVLRNHQRQHMVDALVPGCGIQRLDRKLITTSTAVGDRTRITRLDIVFRQSAPLNLDGFFAFLDIIGAQLTSLLVSIQGNECCMSTEEVVQILRKCRHLEHLGLSNFRLESLDMFVDAYESQDCHIRVLQLRKCTITTPTGFDHFMNTLVDSPSRMARRLRQLEIDFSGTAAFLSPPATVADMLRKNYYLEEVFITLPRDRSHFFDAMLKELPEIRLHVPEKSFPMRSKLAFLSVSHASTTPRATEIRCSMERMDRAILAEIFVFAAPPATRTVCVDVSQ
ncbi:hypothetical protein Poli38472_011219 [Pythium oligandrum]|uniref:Uncharacterized protein n=1 Tax=Pythium oligandrum TaxID=41045 RepID=A0A8K1CQ69_PYTOL|nr:hypothetical protein Poli38472_011219 [Pythium oligandrum]|eukprot:TMW67599.1 hypothetical protein Poli38472_011219 [Pythium oligandrum]